jgi:membrane-bound serine protease (ClpP class)
MDALVLWVIICAALAVFLFAVEVFVPSGGLLGGASFLCLVIAVVLLFLIRPLYGWIGVVAALFLIPAAIGVAIKVFPHTPVGRRLILSDEQPHDEQVRYSSSGEDETGDLVGRVGVAKTELRPGGTVDFDGRRVDCLSVRGVIEPGTKVKVVSAAGFEVKVRPLDRHEEAETRVG